MICCCLHNSELVQPEVVIIWGFAPSFSPWLRHLPTSTPRTQICLQGKKSPFGYSGSRSFGRTLSTWPWPQKHYMCIPWTTHYLPEHRLTLQCIKLTTLDFANKKLEFYVVALAAVVGGKHGTKNWDVMMYLVEKCWANGKWWEIHWLHIRKKQVISCTFKRCTWSCLAMDGLNSVMFSELESFRVPRALGWHRFHDAVSSWVPAPDLLPFRKFRLSLMMLKKPLMRKRMLMWNIYENSSHHVTLGSKKASQVRIPANYWSFKCDGNRSRVQVTRLVNYRMTLASCGQLPQRKVKNPSSWN